MPRYVIRDGVRVARYSRAELDAVGRVGRELVMLSLVATVVVAGMAPLLRWWTLWLLVPLAVLWLLALLTNQAVAFYERAE